MLKVSPSLSKTTHSNGPSAPRSASASRKKPVSNSASGMDLSARMLGAVSSMVMRLSASITPTRKPMEERCPYPVARRLIKKRVHPGGNPIWLMAGTMDGLKRAAASTAYSIVK